MSPSISQTILLLASAFPAVRAACTIPSGALSNTITTGFAVQVQNASFPVIHNRLMNLWSAGGGDQHLYLSPAGAATSNLTLDAGVLGRPPIHAVIQGEYTPEDNTTKIFMTDRNDPRALFDVVYGCSPTGELQKELLFKARATMPGGHLCVRTASGGRYEFRYSPPDNAQVAPVIRPCIQVTLAII